MIDAVVVSRNDEAQGICSFELAAADGSLLPAFSAGAHIDVHLPDAGAPVFAVQSPRRAPPLPDWRAQRPGFAGRLTQLHEQVQAGARLRISAPRNLFPLAEGAQRSLLFAGGIGITPILCMAEQLSHSGHDFELHYCARSSERAAFVERIRNAPFADRLFVHFDEQPETALDIAQVLGNPQEDVHLYVCGPGGFMQHVLDSAKGLGWQEANLHREYFAAAPVDASNDGSFSVQVGSTGQVFEVPADQTVAQVLEQHGIEIAMSCEQVFAAPA